MTELLIYYMAPIMFATLVVFLLVGFPVAFALAANGVLFGLLGIELGLFQPSLLQALPQRVYGIITNETLLAIPFFTFMGLILERSGMAEDLLDTIGQLFGAVRGGVAIAVVIVGAMLAATTGVVAASVISMGLISLPIMLRYGYHRGLATGVITASGTLAQIIPPSLVLIVLADQMGRSIGDFYQAAFIPGFMLVGMYVLYILALAVFKPSWVPALPPEALKYRQPDGSSGTRSLVALLIITSGLSWVLVQWMAGSAAAQDPLRTDEKIVLGLTLGAAIAFTLAAMNRVLKLGLLSLIAERVTFVLIPPLALLFLVLGTIFIGLATPTEAGAMGAVGALFMAILRRRLSFTLLKQALDSTAKLSVFVMFILIGATIFTLSFRGVDGDLWVKGLLIGLPGGELGFIAFISVLVFFLGFFLDFFEIAFVIIPLLVPVANALEIDLVWFGIILAMNLQTSFVTPPFGFALFYLRSVAPRRDYEDPVTRKTIKGVTTEEIYKGSIPFIAIQLTALVLVVAIPGLVMHYKGTGPAVDPMSITIDIPTADFGSGDDQGFDPFNPFGPQDSSGSTAPSNEGPPDDLLRSLGAPPPAPGN